MLLRLIRRWPLGWAAAALISYWFDPVSGADRRRRAALRIQQIRSRIAARRAGRRPAVSPAA